MRLYLAARFIRANELEDHAGLAREHGHIVTSRWHSGQHGDPAAEVDLTDPSMPRYALEDVEDVRSADVLVSFTEGGGGRGGRHVEFGLALGLGKRLVLVGPVEHIFHRLVENAWCFEAWAEALAALDRLDDALASEPDTTRHFVGVSDNGLRVGVGITGRFTGEHRPIPMSALQGGMRELTGGNAFDPLLSGDGSPLLWPVSPAVYAEWQADDEDTPSEDFELLDSDEDELG